MKKAPSTKKIPIRNQKKYRWIRAMMILVLVVMLSYLLIHFIFHKTDVVTTDPQSELEYIYDIDSSAVLDMKLCGGNIVVLTSNYLVYVNRTGVILQKNEHSYQNPSMVVYDNQTLLFDRGGTSYRVENGGQSDKDLQTDTPIYTASIGKNGVYALSCKGEDSLTSLSIFDSNNNKLYYWTCASEYITSLSFSPNGKQISAVVVNGKNASLYSKVYIFHWKSDDEPEEYSYDSALFQANFTSNRNLAILGEASFGHIYSGESETISVYSSSENGLVYFDPSSRYTALLLIRYGSSPQLTVYDEKGDQIFSKSFTESVDSIACSRSRISIAFEDRIETYNYGEKMTGCIHFTDTVSKMLLNSNTLYVLFSNGICTYMSDNNVEIFAPEPQTNTYSNKVEKESQNGAPIADFTNTPTDSPTLPANTQTEG